MGNYLFVDISREKYKSRFIYYDENFNLENFYRSFLLSFRSATGENWPLVMIELAYGK